MTCSKCGKRLLRYDDATLTCKNGHKLKVGRKPLPIRPWMLAVASSSSLAIGLLIGHLT